jgi:hypothetical protein
MAPIESNVRKLPTEAAQSYRAAPHNIEAEQALLGAILVNNEAFYRVSDFLEPRHFFVGEHQKIYEVTSSLIKAGKVASPVTLKTFLPADADIGGMTVSQYLARLASEATTVINALDYGQTIYDCMKWPKVAAMRAAFSVSRRRSPPRSIWRRTPISATENCRVSQRACAISTAGWADCKNRT